MLRTEKEEDGSVDLTPYVTVINLFFLSPCGSQELKVLFFILGESKRTGHEEKLRFSLA